MIMMFPEPDVQKDICHGVEFLSYNIQGPLNYTMANCEASCIIHSPSFHSDAILAGNMIVYLQAEFHRLCNCVGAM